MNLRILAIIKGDRQKESELHNRFSLDRVYGEWFKPTIELLQYIIECLLDELEHPPLFLEFPQRIVEKHNLKVGMEIEEIEFRIKDK